MIVSPDEQRRRAVDDAWKAHAALVDWTGKVDTKASFALTLASALLGAVVTFSAPSRPLASLSDSSLLAYRVGVGALAIAALCAVVAVVPRIRFWGTLSEWPSNVVYFGHLRHWSDPADLARAWERLDVLEMLARQQIAMSKIAWNKHKYVQFSLGFAVLGSALVAASGMTAA